MRHLALYLMAAVLVISGFPPAVKAEPVTIAQDMVGSGSLNLTSYTNPWTDAFTSNSDAFQKYSRSTSSSIPFQLLDDSLVNFPADSAGIIDENNLDPFFGVSDTVNGDTTGPITAEWEFDISSTTEPLVLQIDIGAMGDFEATDVFTWSVSIDGSAPQVIITNSVDEASSLGYTLAGGSTYTLNDPMLANGVPLSNVLQTIAAPIEGTGSTMTVTLEASADGGSEAFAFQNLVIRTGDIVEPEPLNLFIHEVQGNGSDSPFVGELVTVEGIVVGDFQSNEFPDNGDFGSNSGFYLQEEDADADSDPMTSEGIFIIEDGSFNVEVGDLVTVTGIVSETFGKTSINAQSIAFGEGTAPLPAATSLSLPVTSADDYEAYEGMRVIFEQSLVISEYFNFDRFGEIVLALPLNDEGRPYTPTAVELPGSTEYADRAAANLLARIKLDDGRTQQNPDPAIHPNGIVFNLSNRFRGGDLVANATGILDYAFGEYRIQPTAGADYTAVNPRPSNAPEVGGELTVASFNVLNYFTTLDENSAVCGPSNLGCRGADNVEEFNRQRDKIINAIAKMDADVVGLIEIENNATAAVTDLVDGLNAQLGPDYYRFVDTGTIGGDAIKVAFIYQTETVTPEGDFAILDGSVDPLFIDDKNRPALAQTFSSATSGGALTVVVNHLKSKGSDCDDQGDPDLGDGQGNCNGTRTDAAMALANWMATDPTGSGDEDVLIIGDLNAYDKEDPITSLMYDGYTDLLMSYQGEFAYSYVFDGQYGYLDYAMANAALLEQVTGAAAWQINADEQDILDYDTSFKQPAQIALYETNEFRSSDHDPVLVGLNLSDVVLPLAATIDTPEADSVHLAPVTISGTATAPDGVQHVLVGIRDQATLQWWNDGVWGSWNLAVTEVDNPGANNSEWSLDFDPAEAGGSGRYRVFVRAVGMNGDRSDSVARNFKIEPDEPTVPFTAVIDSPVADTLTEAPVPLNGSASAPAGVSRVLVGIRDQETQLWWNGETWDSWVLNPADVTNVGDTEVSWSLSDFNPSSTGGSGRYRVFVRVVDQLMNWSESVAHNFRIGS